MGEQREESSGGRGYGWVAPVITAALAAVGISLSALFACKADLRAGDAVSQSERIAATVIAQGQQQFEVVLDQGLWTTSEASPERSLTLELGEFGVPLNVTVFRLERFEELEDTPVGFTWLVIRNQSAQGCLGDVQVTALEVDGSTVVISKDLRDVLIGGASDSIVLVPHELPLATDRRFCPGYVMMIPIAVITSPSEISVRGCDVSLEVSATLSFEATVPREKTVTAKTHDCLLEVVPVDGGLGP